MNEPSLKKDVRRVLRSDPVNSTTRIDLMVIKWEKSKGAVLEKRKIWTKDGEERYCKLSGLTKDDFQFVVDHKDEIFELMEERV